MGFPKDIAELLKADVISQETADKISEYYQKKGWPFIQPAFRGLWNIWSNFI